MTIYCACETPVMDVEHDAGCRRCGRPVDFSPTRGAILERLGRQLADVAVECTCTYSAFAKPGGGTGWDVARYDPACPEHGSDGS